MRRETFAALARRPAGEDLYPHLTRADLLVIAPLTANTMAKLAYGLADDVLTEAALAHRGPVLVAPAMNPRMWAHPATQANAATLRERGVELIGPDEGETAEGELGVGRMSEPQEIFERVQELLGARNGTLAGKRVLVSAGGTREPLDAVRFVGNRSSGRMGVALADEARRRGAEVTLIASNLAVAAPGGRRGRRGADRGRRRARGRSPGPEPTSSSWPRPFRITGRWKPTKPSARKTRRHGRSSWSRRWTCCESSVSSATNGQVLVGFAAETGEDGLERAREKLHGKRVDLIVYNDVSREDVGFDTTENEVVLLSATGERRVEKAPKEAIAAAILDEVERLV